MDIKNVLTIDGGGMFGVVAAETCVLLEKRLGTLLGEVFDFVSGTSTGAILGAGIACGISAEDAMDLYFREGPRIFRKRSLAIGLLRPRYKGKDLREAMIRHFGDRRLRDLKHPHFSASVYDVSCNETRFLRSWSDGDIPVADAVTASSSAPTYHPMHRINEMCLADGGVFALNPASSALADAISLWPQSSFRVVSLGTGQYGRQPTPCSDRDRRKGKLFWGASLPGIFLDGIDESVDNVMRSISSRASWLDYFRFTVSLDVPKNADELRSEVLNAARAAMHRVLEADSAFDELIRQLSSRRTTQSPRRVRTSRLDTQLPRRPWSEERGTS